MKYPQEAYHYLESEHIRLLMEGNRIPSVEDRVMEAFLAGVKSVRRSYSNLDVYSNNKGEINFPRITL